MVWLKNNVNFQPNKLEKDHFLMKFGWNFKFYTSGHPVKGHPSLHRIEINKEQSSETNKAQQRTYHRQIGKWERRWENSIGHKY